jgi:NTP pyrophosphatase (non-canonical NTP hydrolase)
MSADVLVAALRPDGNDEQLVRRFAEAMAERLRYNRGRGKSGWEYMTAKQLLHRAEQELGELRRAVENEADALEIAEFKADVVEYRKAMAP